jgi:Amt family ammonium transporter
MRTGVLLRAAAEGLDCVGVALLTPAGAIQRLSHDESGSRAVLERCIQALGPSLAQRVIEQRGTLATVCADCVDGRAAELVAVPVFAADPRPVAIVVALRLDPDPDFVPAALTTLRRIANTLSRRISRQRDTSTGLSTWGAFLNRVRILRERAAEPAEVAILYGNIDRLHLLNNALGMATGDKVIALAALVIRRCVRSARSAICRLSGDRFVVALQGQSLSQGRAVAERIRDQFERDASRIFGSLHALSISWGVVAAGTGSRDLEQAVNDAELACRAAKDRGRNRVETFEPNDASMIRRHDDVDALRLLRAALNTERIVVYAQPIVPLLDASLPHGHELLVRLDGDDRIIEPSAFMSAAARYQILPDLDRAVVMRAFRQLRNAAPDRTELPFPVSINICAPTICSEGFADWLIEQMQRYAVPAAQLTLEITETAAASSLAAVQAVIVRLRPLGVRFAIDDFGTGVNSLSYLKSLSVDCIKLDGSYVRDLETDARSEALVGAIVQLATGMGIRTVAEHVDSIALRSRLAEIGVQYAQGFAVGRPEPLDMVLSEASRSLHRPLLAAG